MLSGAEIEGGCHCGAVRFRARLQPGTSLSALEVVECNCSICTMKAYLHVFIPESDFELTQGAPALTTYRFNTGAAAHTFCSTCGVAPFYRPRSHPDCVDVNARCVDGLDLTTVRRSSFDGANWEDNIHHLREAGSCNP